MVQYAVDIQYRLPCISPQQKVHPHGQDKYKYDKGTFFHFHIPQNQGQGV